MTPTTPEPTWRTRAFVEHTMGMAVSLHIRVAHDEFGSRTDELADAAHRAFAALHRADDVFSTYRADSDLMRIRRGELDETEADPWYADVRALCDEAATVTNGLFTTDLVGPGGSRGYDPTGLVKGFAVERAADILRAVPGIVFCLNAGGDLTCDAGPGASASIERVWRVGISDPRDAAGVVATIELTQGALATSGTAQRGAHIVDPRTNVDENRRWGTGAGVRASPSSGRIWSGPTCGPPPASSTPTPSPSVAWPPATASRTCRPDTLPPTGLEARPAGRSETAADPAANGPRQEARVGAGAVRRSGPACPLHPRYRHVFWGSEP